MHACAACVACGIGTALRSVEAQDATMPSLELYAQKLENARRRLGWLSSLTGNMLVRVDATVKRTSKPPPGLL
jgi:hypothetical protein